MNNKSTASFKKGDRVRYNGDTGRVTSTNSRTVFCDFGGYGKSTPCNPNELEKL